jgi:hypothetical protein
LFEHNPIVLTNETPYEEHELEKEDIESTEEEINTSDVLPAIKTIQSYAYVEEPINYKKIFIVSPNINNEIKTNTKTSPPSTTKVLKNVQIDTLWNTFSCKKKSSPV